MGGSSKKVTVGYRYHLGLHFVLCHGTADNISRITVDKRVAWEGNSSGGRINVDAPELFGGETREGGVAGALDFLPGSATQAQNDYLQARLGTDIPAFRGVVSAVLRQMYIGLNPYVKNWAFRVQRIFRRADGSAQWYPEKAQIGNETLIDYTPFSRTYTSSALGINPQMCILGVADGVITGQYRIAKGSGEIDSTGAFVNPLDALSHPVTAQTHLFDVATGSYIGAGASVPVAFWNAVTTAGKTYYSVGRVGNKNLWVTIGQNPNRIFFGNNGTGLPNTEDPFDHSLPSPVGSYSLHCVTVDSMNERVFVIYEPTGTFDGNNAAGAVWYELASDGGIIRSGQAGITTNIYQFGYGASSSYHHGACFFDSKNSQLCTVYGAGSGAVVIYNVQQTGISSIRYLPDPFQTNGMSYYLFTSPSVFLQTGVAHAFTGPNGGLTAPQYYNRFNADVEITPGSADMNPSHIIRECLTDRDWGMGYADSDIDDAAFAAAADALHAETFGISIVWDRQSTIEAFIEQILRHIDAALYVDRRTGKFVLKLIRNDYTVGALLTLDESNIERVEGLGRPAFGELINSISVAYWDAETGNDAAITLDDTALVQMQGGVINTTAQYPGITSRSLAARVAQRDLRTLSQPLLSCTIYATRAASALDIGDAFVLTWPAAGISGVVMRVTGLALGDGRNNRVRITCTQDAFALPAQAVIAPPADEWVSPIETPLPATQRVAQEAPYYELVQLIGQLNADARLAANPDAGWLMVSAARPQDSAINAVVSVDAGAGFEQAAPLDFAPWAQLVADIGRADTAITVESGIDLAAVTLGTHAQIGAELVRIDAIDLDTGAITIGRGVLDTVPQPHSAGDGMLFWDAYAVSDEVEYVAAESVSVKVQPATSAGLLAIDAAPADVAVMDRRARRPYPPANLRIGGVLMPSTIGATAELGLIEWAHRDRTQQTSGTLADTTAGNIGPEAGTTYTLRIYDELDVMGFELTGITGTSHTYTEADELADMPQDDGLGGDRLNTQLRIELFAVRGGLESWQKHNLTVVRS